MARLAFLPRFSFFSPAAEGPSPRVLLVQDFRGATRPVPRDENPDISLSRLWVSPRGGEVELKLSREAYNFKVTQTDMIIIERLVARTPGQGHGHEAMRMLAAMADRHNVHLSMFMEPIAPKAKDMDALIVWASRHGFVQYGLPQGLYWREPGAGPLTPGKGPE